MMNYEISQSEALGNEAKVDSSDCAVTQNNTQSYSCFQCLASQYGEINQQTKRGVFAALEHHKDNINQVKTSIADVFVQAEKYIAIESNEVNNCPADGNV